jgi:hypothetical protein
MGGVCDFTIQGGHLIPTDSASYVVMPLYDYCGVEFYDVVFLKTLYKYFHDTTRFGSGVDKNQTLEEFLENRRAVISDEGGNVENYNLPNIRQHKKSAGQLNKNTVYERDILREIEGCHLNRTLTLKGLRMGICGGLERWDLQESLQMGLRNTLEPMYHEIYLEN